MSFFELLELAILVAVAFVLALFALWIVARLEGRKRNPDVGFVDYSDTAVAFLFQDERLINTTIAGSQMLSAAPDNASDLARLLSMLLPRYPQLDRALTTLHDRGKISLGSTDRAAQIDIEWRGDRLHIQETGVESPEQQVSLDRPSFDAMQVELETLRATAEHAPFLVWRQSPDGAISWANSAYLALSQINETDAPAQSWPPTNMFDTSLVQSPGNARPSQRVTAHIAGEAEPRWFECFETSIGEDSLFTAVAADRVVKAEVALRDFVQTLTKTFAHLTIGLAIFDKQRRLKLFNPALTDLTLLPPEFLSRRPTLQGVLDKLREKKMIPEPKDYKSWRQTLHALESASINGTYEETRSLATGQTYRVTGRPHPGGALAFLFEDISAEVSLTRRFRAELETSQAVFDSLQEAIAVFSPSGSLTLTNASYCRMWGIDVATGLSNFGIIDATKSWSHKCAPSPVWGDAREFVGAFGERVEWSAQLRMINGRALNCRFAPIAGGATLVGFSLASPDIILGEVSSAPVLATRNEPITA